MIALRKASDRGVSTTSWLDSRHTFSFAEYYDPKENGFSVLRVINDDRVAGGGGFPSHGHREMEIITYVLQGALEHRDSLGTHSVIPAGDLQRMTAGKGIVHSEFNHSPSDPVHFLQIWIIPAKANLTPGYEQQTLDPQTGARPVSPGNGARCARRRATDQSGRPRVHWNFRSRPVGSGGLWTGTASLFSGYAWKDLDRRR